MPTTPWLSLVAPAVALIVGLLAVFQEQIRRALIGPKLRVWFDPQSLVDSHLTHWTDSRTTADGKVHTLQIPTFWVRLRAANIGGYAAHSVEVLATELWQRPPGQPEYSLDPKFSPVALKWCYTGEPVLDLLSPGTEKQCDLLEIRDPSKGPGGIEFVSPLQPTATLQLAVHLNLRPGVLTVGDYRLVLVVAAADASARRATVTFTVPEKWTSDEREMQRLVNVRGLPSQTPLMPEEED